MHIGDYVRRERRRLSYTQKELAEVTHVTQHLISAIEKGSSNPSVPTLMSLYSILGDGLLDYFRDQSSKQ